MEIRQKTAALDHFGALPDPRRHAKVLYPIAVNNVLTLYTLHSIESLGLKPGVEAIAVIKATSVMMAVE